MSFALGAPVHAHHQLVRPGMDSGRGQLEGQVRANVAAEPAAVQPHVGPHVHGLEADAPAGRPGGAREREALAVPLHARAVALRRVVVRVEGVRHRHRAEAARAVRAGRPGRVEQVAPAWPVLRRAGARAACTRRPRPAARAVPRSRSEGSASSGKQNPAGPRTIRRPDRSSSIPAPCARRCQRHTRRSWPSSTSCARPRSTPPPSRRWRNSTSGASSPPASGSRSCSTQAPSRNWTRSFGTEPSSSTC